MTKSGLYYMMQIIVLEEGERLSNSDKLEMLRELFIQEDLAKFSEEQEAKQA